MSVGFAVGTFTAIMGPSGSGKSTPLQCTAGLDALTSGQAFIGEHDLSVSIGSTVPVQFAALGARPRPRR